MRIVVLEVQKRNGFTLCCAKGFPDIYGIADHEADAINACKNVYTRRFGEADFRRHDWQVGNEQGAKFLEVI